MQFISYKPLLLHRCLNLKLCTLAQKLRAEIMTDIFSAIITMFLPEDGQDKVFIDKDGVPSMTQTFKNHLPRWA